MSHVSCEHFVVENVRWNEQGEYGYHEEQEHMHVLGAHISDRTSQRQRTVWTGASTVDATPINIRSMHATLEVKKNSFS